MGLIGRLRAAWAALVSDDLAVLSNAIGGMSKATKATLEVAGFMRLSKDQAAIKTFPE